MASKRTDLRGLLVFTTTALVLGWAVMIPLWIVVGGEPVYGSRTAGEAAGSDSLGADPTAAPSPEQLMRQLMLQVFPSAMMLTPALAAWIAVRWVDGIRFRPMFAELGLAPRRGAEQRRHPAVTALLWSAAAIVVTVLLVMLSVAVAILFGLLEPDWSFPLLAESATAAGIPAAVLVLIQVVAIPVAAVMPNGLFAAGEEIGWRGYMLPRLVRLTGIPAAVALSGAVWGLWHAPVILLGYNFSRPGIDGLLLMITGSICVGAWFSWLRIRGGSVWPAIVAHGALNAAAGLYLLVSASPDVDGATAGPLGVAGWVVFGLAGAVLCGTLMRSRRLKTQV
ncbi:MAG: CPBP family intramembrane glutamic endopeptidase [Brevibacterium yomogidense]|uniref:CAAX amino terminal protease family protein n=1 Tax=Brevibacterium yomogidense TaxID=946573 RepID=A0A1X6XKF8_9MICO|nr:MULTISPECIES: CPBP family intramembrane glutamic endopeptidase [Brevibacterium]SLM99772.1 CAAX amino terminal protease family protein [Brevibacterium yomogidense]SMX69425.1 CAAX protease self-immunity [Brevibacterium sp. Mu109]